MSTKKIVSVSVFAIFATLGFAFLSKHVATSVVPETPNAQTKPEELKSANRSQAQAEDLSDTDAQESAENKTIAAFGSGFEANLLEARKKLGDDEIGREGFKFFAGVIDKLVKGQKNFPICTTPQNCPVAPLEFYSELSRRLPVAQYSFLNFVMQKGVIKSEIGKSDKINFFEKQISQTAGVQTLDVKRYSIMTMRQYLAMRPDVRSAVRVAQSICSQSRNQVYRSTIFGLLSSNFRTASREELSGSGCK